jgi:hypothetical protein
LSIEEERYYEEHVEPRSGSSCARCHRFRRIARASRGLATCNSGPKEKWQPQDKLKKQLEDKKWQVRRIKVDGGCYEVYGIDDKGKKVEAYFHPLTLEPVPASKP